MERNPGRFVDRSRGETKQGSERRKEESRGVPDTNSRGRSSRPLIPSLRVDFSNKLLRKANIWRAALWSGGRSDFYFVNDLFRFDISREEEKRRFLCRVYFRHLCVCT